MSKRVSLNERALDNFIFATSDGGKRHGRPRGEAILAGDADHGEAERERQSAKRNLLREIIGDEEALVFLLEIASCEITNSDLARTLGVHRSTIGRQLRELYTQLRQIALTAQAALGAIAADPAGTRINPRTAKVVKIDAWAVSLQGYEERHKALTLRVLCAYFRKHLDLFVRRRELYCGLWTYEQEFYLDVSRLFPDLPVALAFACENKQKAVTNVLTRQTIYLEEGEERRTA